MRWAGRELDVVLEVGVGHHDLNGGSMTAKGVGGGARGDEAGSTDEERGEGSWKELPTTRWAGSP
jgi:hypothetical protein